MMHLPGIPQQLQIFSFLLLTSPVSTGSSSPDSFSSLSSQSSGVESAGSILSSFLSTSAETTAIASANSNYCGSSIADAQTKLCSGIAMPCPGGGGCNLGEACFLNVVCDSASEDATNNGETSSSWSPSSSSTSSKNNNNNGQNSVSAYTLLGSPETTMNFLSEPYPSLTSFSSNPNTISSQVESTLQSIEEAIDTKLFLYETPLSEWIPSTVYRFNGFFEGLQLMHSVGVAGKRMYMGFNYEEGEEGNDATRCEHCFMYGLVNVAAFLAQAMKETIRYDACDENSWDRVGDLEMYPISNSCGQLGQSYQDYHCSEEEKHMECTVDPDMTITAVTHAKWWGAPGPLMCGPKSLYPQTGYWDYAYECNNPWGNPPETCDVYEGQKAGKAINDVPYPNAAGRTDIEGCCWWGRGVIQTSGICNFGKLNYYLGKRAFLEGRESRYPDIDFCKDPEIICTSEENRELKWIAGFFYWVDQVQPYDNGGWNYLNELRKFVDGGMVGEDFINSVSGIVNRGCHNPPCGTGDLDGGPERADNFFRILKELEFSFVPVVPEPPPTPPPVPAPTQLPTSPPVPLPNPLPTFPPVPLSIPLPTSPPVSFPTPSLTSAPVAAVVTYSCGEGTQLADGNSLEEPPPSLDLTFDYEMHSSLDVAVSQALEDVKQSILSDIAGQLGCIESTGRKLQASSGIITGFMSSRHDLPDPDVAGCLVEVEMNSDPSVCAPVKGEITLFAQPGSSEEDLLNAGDFLKSKVEESMDSGQYESSTVKKVVWVGDRDLLLEDFNPLPPAVRTEPQPDTGTDWMKIALYSLAGVCALLFFLLCLIIPSTRRKSLNHEDELAVMEYMNAQRESYNERWLTPEDAIKRRTEQLRAIQQGNTLQSIYPVENGATASESEDEGSYYRRRNSGQRDNHRSMPTLPVRPPEESSRNISGFRRQSQGFRSEPIRQIDDTGPFYVEDEQAAENVFISHKSGESHGYAGSSGYEPHIGHYSSEESYEDNEIEQPVAPPPRRLSKRDNGASANIHRSNSKVDRTIAQNAMSKEERQRRINRARSSRRNID